jgi:beta-glucosidase
MLPCQLLPQIEGSGAGADGGRAESIWDAFAAQPGRIAGNDTAALAADHYRQHAQDVRLLAALGVKHYR